MNRVAVASKSFSKNKFLRSTILERYPNTKFNDHGLRFDDDTLIKFLDGFEGAIIGLEVINEKVLSALPQLSVISKYGVGLDAIDTTAMRRHGVQLGWTPGVNKRSVSELVVAQMISVLRHLYDSNADVKSGAWHVRKSHQLSSQTIGIIGLGNIGQDLVKLLSSFGCELIATDTANRNDFATLNKVKLMGLSSLLKTADIVSIHTPLNNETRNLINTETLAKMKPGSILINYARGGIVNQDAVANALLDNRLGAAVFDVFEPEPPIINQLIMHQRFFGSAHIGGSSYEAIKAMGLAAIDGLSIG
jgi:phosphoglycerate dehydrogenase-like enzyme